MVVFGAPALTRRRASVIWASVSFASASVRCGASSAKQRQRVEERSDRTEEASEERGQRSDGANPERRPPENSHPSHASAVPRGAEPSEERGSSCWHGEHEHSAHEELSKGNLGGWILKDRRIVQGVEVSLVSGLERSVVRLSYPEEQHPRGNDSKACDRVSVVLMTHGAPHE
jgi:hypothetical protein